jgi:hypothetical protein
MDFWLANADLLCRRRTVTPAAGCADLQSAASAVAQVLFRWRRNILASVIAFGAPEHMDPWSRNERLYRHLLGLGLCVFPITDADDETKIDHLVVSAGLPIQRGTQQPAETAVHAAIEGSQVGGEVAAPESLGNGMVVQFPPPRG